MTPETAAKLHYANQNRLPMWVITERPTDYPEGYVARLHWTLPEPVATEHSLLAATLATLRQMLPPGLFCLARYPADDPVIVETWL